ncbi:MAG: hypothetical protein R2684_12070 [Pyrinomonadaceae bacterium]
MQIVNEVLKSLGQDELAYNRRFKMNPNFSGHTFVEFAFDYRDSRSIPLLFDFEGGGLRIDIDGIPEAVVFSNKKIEDNKSRIVEFLTELFTSYITMDKVNGFFKTTRMSLSNRHGEIIGIHHLRGFWCERLFFKQVTCNYLPCFDMPK